MIPRGFECPVCHALAGNDCQERVADMAGHQTYLMLSTYHGPRIDLAIQDPAIETARWRK